MMMPDQHLGQCHSVICFIVRDHVKWLTFVLIQDVHLSLPHCLLLKCSNTRLFTSTVVFALRHRKCYIFPLNQLFVAQNIVK
jgi:hypothetical protein